MTKPTCDCPRSSDGVRRLVSHRLACLREQRGGATLDEHYGRRALREAR